MDQRYLEISQDIKDVLETAFDPVDVIAKAVYPVFPEVIYGGLSHIDPTADLQRVLERSFTLLHDPEDIVHSIVDCSRLDCFSSIISSVLETCGLDPEFSEDSVSHFAAEVSRLVIYLKNSCQLRSIVLETLLGYFNQLTNELRVVIVIDSIVSYDRVSPSIKLSANLNYLSCANLSPLNLFKAFVRSVADSIFPHYAHLF